MKNFIPSFVGSAVIMGNDYENQNKVLKNLNKKSVNKLDLLTPQDLYNLLCKSA